MVKFKLILLLIVYFHSIVNCARILKIFNFPSKSMHLAGIRMAEILVEDGHNVTTVSPFKIHPKPDNFQHIFLDTIADFHEVIDGDMYGWNMHPMAQAYSYASMGIYNCNLTMRNPAFRRILDSKETFDLVILQGDFSESLVYIAQYLKVPLILHTSVYSSSWSNHYVHNSAPPSFIPNVLSDYTSGMTFFQRFDNALLSLNDELVRYFHTLPEHNRLVKENFPSAPDISTYINTASLLFINSDTSIYDPVPILPGMVDIGGFHVRPPKRLPKDLDDILNNATHGVIYFSMGSNIKSSKMPKEKVQGLLKIFANLKQTVLWKWEDEELPGKPDNVIIRQWLPQNDILAHKNMKLFITHGGFYSNIETIYHGVPCVAIAVFIDQITNARRAKEMGYAEWLKFDDLTDANFEWAVNQVLNNPSYTNIAKKRSVMMRDKPLPQADLIKFWVDYVIRQGGAEHLRVTSLKLYWYQFFCFDIIAFVGLVSILITIALKYLLGNLIQMLTIKKQKQKIK